MGLERAKDPIVFQGYDFVVNPFGINIAMSWSQVVGILMLVSRYEPKLFVEVGIFKGGIGTFLIQRARYCSDFNYIGLEIVNDAPNKAFVKDVSSLQNANIVFGDCFDKKICGDLGEKIKNAGLTFVFCDGGDKAREVLEYSKFLKIGDIILTHDYPGEINDEDLSILKNNFIELENDIIYRKIFGIPAYMRIR